MGPWVQDAVDLIQYANGDTNTTWGAQRAANGHPAPFNLQYLEIGNENGGSYYNDRYAFVLQRHQVELPGDAPDCAATGAACPTSRAGGNPG